MHGHGQSTTVAGLVVDNRACGCPVDECRQAVLFERLEAYERSVSSSQLDPASLRLPIHVPVSKAARQVIDARRSGCAPPTLSPSQSAGEFTLELAEAGRRPSSSSRPVIGSNCSKARLPSSGPAQLEIKI